jgi:hypothetical protein
MATSFVSDNDKNRKTKKRKVFNPPLPGSKFLNFQDYIQRKGGAMRKKQASRHGGRKKQTTSSIESDLILCSMGNVVSVNANRSQTHTISNSDGFCLEVVLPELGGGGLEASVCSQVPCLNAEREVVVVESGVMSLVGRNSPISSNYPCSGSGSVDRDTSAAHHIIDI